MSDFQEWFEERGWRYMNVPLPEIEVDGETLGGYNHQLIMREEEILGGEMLTTAVSVSDRIIEAEEERWELLLALANMEHEHQKMQAVARFN